MTDWLEEVPIIINFEESKIFLLRIVSVGNEHVWVVGPWTCLHVLSEHTDKDRVVDQVEIERHLSELIPLVAHQSSAQRVAQQLCPVLLHHQVQRVILLHQVRRGRLSPALKYPFRYEVLVVSIYLNFVLIYFQ